LKLSREELAFISAAIEIRVENEREEERKLKAKSPKRR
jgi:hypothetical protein